MKGTIQALARWAHTTVYTQLCPFCVSKSCIEAAMPLPVIFISITLHRNTGGQQGCSIHHTYYKNVYNYCL